MYNKVDFGNSINPDEPTDALGYIGLTSWYREKQGKTNKLELAEFVKILVKNNRLKDVFHTIGQIDKDHNGYVTRNEMDDILKLYY